jgi:hypothetical protein
MSVAHRRSCAHRTTRAPARFVFRVLELAEVTFPMSGDGTIVGALRVVH